MSETKWTIRQQSINFTDDTADQIIWGSALPAISPGNQQGQRIGNDIQYKYLKLRVGLSVSEASLVTTLRMRWVVFVPLKSWVDTDAVETKSFIFDIGPGDTSLRSTINNKNVRILQDKEFFIGTADTFSLNGLRATKLWRMGRKIWNKVSFRNGLNLATDPKDTVFWALLFPNITGTAQFQANLTLDQRISFKDL